MGPHSNTQNSIPLKRPKRVRRAADAVHSVGVSPDKENDGHPISGLARPGPTSTNDTPGVDPVSWFFGDTPADTDTDTPADTEEGTAKKIDDRSGEISQTSIPANDDPTTPGGSSMTPAMIQKIKDTLIDQCGMIAFTAEELGIPLRDVERAIEENPDLQEAARYGRELLLDTAEQCLLESIKMGDARAAAFALKTLGGSRGWRENLANINVNVLSPAKQLEKVREIFGIVDDGDDPKMIDVGDGK